MYKSICLFVVLLNSICCFAQSSTKNEDKDTTHALKEVSVKAQRPSIEFKRGAIVMDVEHDVLAAGSTVLELLKRLPGVNVDAQNNVTVDGRGGIGFMIDGKLQQIPAAQMISILSAMNAESVASIELIKNPSAKYDAAGTAGLINIVSKKVKLRGTSGNVFESIGYGKRGGSASAFSLNYKTNKLTLFTNTSYTNKDALTETAVNRTLNTTAGTTVISSTGRSEILSSVLNFRGGLEYELTASTTIGLNVTDGPNTSNEYPETRTTIMGIKPFVYDRFNNKAYNPEHYNNPSVGVYGVHVFDTAGTQLKFSADYTRFLDEYSGMNTNRFFMKQAEVAPMTAYNNILDLDFSIITEKLDFTKSLGKTIALEAGEKASFAENNNNSELQYNDPGTEIYHTDKSFANCYNYKEQVLAGYLSLSKTLTKGALQIGLRGEQTNIDAANRANGYTFQQHYFNLFPNIGAEYALNQKTNLQLSYSYRIDRPAYNQLNPIKIFNDALSYMAGNPELKPQYSHKINLDLSRGGSLHFSLAYTHTDNSIYNYSFTNYGSQINVDTTFNFAFSDQITYGMFLQQQLLKWYSIQASANFMYGNRRGVINDVNSINETFAVQANMNNSITLPKNYRLQLNGRYTSPYKDGIQQYRQRASVDIALQKKMLKDKLSATLGLYDVFYTDYGSFSSVLRGQEYYSMQRPDTRRLRLTLSYRFGNMKIDRKLNEEKDNRIKKGA